MLSGTFRFFMTAQDLTARLTEFSDVTRSTSFAFRTSVCLRHGEKYAEAIAAVGIRQGTRQLSQRLLSVMCVFQFAQSDNNTLTVRPVQCSAGRQVDSLYCSAALTGDKQ